MMAEIEIIRDANLPRVDSSAKGKKPSKKRTPTTSKKEGKRWSWKKPGDKPKRNLSVYNYFYMHVKDRMRNASGGKKIGGFKKVADTVSVEWKELEKSDPTLLADCKRKAAEDLIRYQGELAVWKALHAQVEKGSRQKDVARELATRNSAWTMSQYGCISSSVDLCVVLQNATNTTPMTDPVGLSMCDDCDRSKVSYSDDDLDFLGVCKNFCELNDHVFDPDADLESLDDEPFEYLP